MRGYRMSFSRELRPRIEYVRGEGKRRRWGGIVSDIRVVVFHDCICDVYVHIYTVPNESYTDCHSLKFLALALRIVL